jgi:uncharacterized protein (TIGR03067 family)
MKRFALMAALMVVPAFVVLAADDKPASPDGSYKVTSLSKGGMKAPEEVTKSFEGVTIKGDKFTMKAMGEAKVATIKVDAKAKPATIDITPDDEKEKGKTMLGIWKLEKNVLTIALTEGKDSKRPADFDGKGKGDIVIELTKDEPKKEEPKKDK